jgi:hypothetical protein
MQYILSEEEYKELHRQANRPQLVTISKTKLQALCIKIADEMPIPIPWDRTAPPEAWGCILTHKGEWYCDQCPVQTICPHDNKEWSK